MVWHPSEAGLGAQSNRTEEGRGNWTPSFPEEGVGAPRAESCEVGVSSCRRLGEGWEPQSDALRSSGSSGAETEDSVTHLAGGATGEGDLHMRQGERPLSVIKPSILGMKVLTDSIH